MTQIRVRLDGAEDVIRELQKRGELGRVALEAALLAGAEIIRVDAAARASGSIASNMIKDTMKKSAKGVTVGVGPDRKVWYAHFLEVGTRTHVVKPKNRKALKIGDQFASRAVPRGAKKRPYLRPAFDTQQDNAKTEIGNKMKDALRAD